jgi:hypothetical protein
VGIGTASPFGTTANRICLSVNGTTDASINVGSGGVQRAYLYGDASLGRVGTIGALPLAFATNDTERARIDTSGNLSLGGFAPSAWNSGYRFMQFSDATGAFFGGSSYAAQMGANAYINSSSQWIYGGSSYKPARYEQFDSAHSWFTAPSGTAGNVISWTQAMTLNSSGDLQIGTTNSASSRLRVLGASSGGGKVYIDTNGAFGGTDTSTLGFSVYQDGGVRYNSHAEIRCIGTGDYSAALAFFTQNPGTYPNTVTERARINSSGNLGLGTSSPDTLFHMLKNGVGGSAPNQPELRIQHNDINGIGTGGSNGGILGFVNLQRDNTAWAADAIWGRLNFSCSQPTSGSAQLCASILAAADGVMGGQTSPSYLAFYTSDSTNGGNNVERMRLDSNGNVIMKSGTSGNSAKFYIRTSDNTSLSTYLGKEAFWTVIGANPNEGWKFRNDTPVNVFTINGGTTNFNASLLGSLTQNASDSRLKTNVEQITGALNKVCSLTGITYNWNELALELSRLSPAVREVGVFAQDVQQVLPEAVSIAPFDMVDGKQESASGENYLTIQYEKLTPLLIEAIKEQQALITQLQADVAALKGASA